MGWPCFNVFWFSKDNPTGHSERNKKKRQTGEEMGRQCQRVDRNGLCQLFYGRWKQGKMERGCCEFICVAPTTAQGYVIEQNRLGLGYFKGVCGWFVCFYGTTTTDTKIM